MNQAMICISQHQILQSCSPPKHLNSTRNKRSTRSTGLNYMPRPAHLPLSTPPFALLHQKPSAGRPAPLQRSLPTIGLLARDVYCHMCTSPKIDYTGRKCGAVRPSLFQIRGSHLSVYQIVMQQGIFPFCQYQRAGLIGFMLVLTTCYRCSDSQSASGHACLRMHVQGRKNTNVASINETR
ncbi:uncharacterized protein BCR38DRAFT_444150 [Pseudomassariella vexata]|uniref:Uncharacterized protein n=1 Tax=Pseudomassariella vexata TaxID=1141098 RepID=A0A1Y2DLN1_9PEZI|nr:uncharacterized protein BCR38DRAFT_444150 [Pseudomassariella vexata]ORY60167.1 hypothetical protein BCR38DRAFT_444150 [Pseudomassariella vexata]